jgi:isocitrate dehydrogenase
VLGSAVNPVLREGNSDRRVATSVKQYAKNHPHSMGAWSKDSRSHVSHMAGGDFYANEQSAVVAATGKVRIELTDASGKTTVLKDSIAVAEGDVIAASVMSRRRAHRVLREERSPTRRPQASCCRCTSRRR